MEGYEKGMKYKLPIIVVVLFIAALGLAIGERLPDISSDTNNWGSILNAFLNVSHTENGSINSGMTFNVTDINISGRFQTNLTNCDTIDTDASGVLSCGTDSGVSGTVDDEDVNLSMLDNNTILRTGNLSDISLYINETSNVSQYVLTETDTLSLHLTQNNWGDDGWINWVNPNFAFNQSKLAVTYYSANQSSTVAGTLDDSSGLNQTNHTDGNYDGNTFNFTEAAGAPGLDLRINFTGIDDFTEGVMRYYTSNLAGDEPIIQLWNYDDSDWEDYPPMTESTSYATISQPVFDVDNHIGAGADLEIVQMRIYKSSNGNTGNHYFIDWISIAKGFGVPSGEEIDPFAIHTNHINYSQFNYENGQLNMNSSYKPLNTTHSDTCSAFSGSITESQISDLSHIIFTLENVSNVTPYTQVTGHPAFSNFKLENVSNTTAWENIINVPAYSNFQLENVSNSTPWTQLHTYATGCTNQFVRDIDDTLTCETVDSADIAAGAIDDTHLAIDYIQSAELNNTDVKFNNLTVTNTNTTFGTFELGNYNSTCSGFRFGSTGGWILSCEP